MSSLDSDPPLTPEEAQRAEVLKKIFGGLENLSLTQDINLNLSGVDLRESNATRKLLQVSLQREDAWHGLSVMRLLEKPNNETPEIPTELKKRLKRTINNFKSLYSQVLSDQEGRVWSRYDNNDQNEEDEDEEDSSDEFSDTDEYDWQHWIPALMDYELYKGYAKNNAEMGDLLFVHKSMKKFVLVNLCGPKLSPDGTKTYEEDYEARLRSQAQRFLAFAHYLQIEDVEWVRATYTTEESQKLHANLLSKLKKSLPSKAGSPPVFHLTLRDLVPCFTSKTLGALDTTISNCQFNSPNTNVKQSVLLEEGAQDPTEMKFKYFDMNLGKLPLTKKCDSCQRSFAPEQLKACSACRGVLYCSEKCQKKEWKYHRLILCPR